MNRSTVLKRSFKEVHNAESMISSSNTTRWSSEFDCAGSAASIVRNRNALVSTYNSASKNLPLQANDFEDLESLRSYLAPAREMTKRLQAKSNPQAVVIATAVIIVVVVAVVIATAVIVVVVAVVIAAAVIVAVVVIVVGTVAAAIVLIVLV